jgi:hypothetical protein
MQPIFRTQTLFYLTSLVPISEYILHEELRQYMFVYVV